MTFRSIEAGRAVAAAAAAMAMAVGVFGCSGGSFVPPPAPGLGALSDPSADAASPRLTMILVPGPSPEGEIWEAAARQAAGRARSIISVTRPPVGAPPSRQAELIREAAAGGAPALIVDPLDGPEVAEALNDVRAGGTVVVLLDRTVPDRDPAKPLARVVFAPMDEPGRALVGAVLADVKKAGLPADGHALVAIKPDAGREGRAAADGLVGALKAGGFTAAEVVPIEPDDDEASFVTSSKRLEDRTTADPKVTAILGVGETAVRTALNARLAVRKAGPRLLAVGGCLTMLPRFGPDLLAAPSGFLDRNQPDLGREAVLLALDLARGLSTPVVRVVPIPFVAPSPGDDPARDLDTPAPKAEGPAPAPARK